MNRNRASIRMDAHREDLGRPFEGSGRAEHSQIKSVVGQTAASPSSPDDRKLCERIVQTLRATGYLSLRDLSVTAVDGLVTLRGRVPSYYLKQVVHSAVRELPGVVEMRDHLEVIAIR